MKLSRSTLLCALIVEIALARPVNAAAIAIADASEGCVLRTYLDPAGVLTGGWGHVGSDLPPLGTAITQEQADAWRAADMARAAAFVDAHVKVPLTDNQFSALAEWTFNVGVGNFLGSTLLRMVNARRFDQVPAQLMRWTKAGGKVLPGLVTRRQKEVALWGTSEWITSQPVVADATPAPAPTPSICSVRPSPPSLIERIRAWLHGNPQVPT